MRGAMEEVLYEAGVDMVLNGVRAMSASTSCLRLFTCNSPHGVSQLARCQIMSRRTGLSAALLTAQ